MGSDYLPSPLQLWV